jgi:hypothetical protein
MSSLFDFAKRHRRKFVAGGVALGGAAIAFSLLDRHIHQVRDDERKKQLEIVRKRNHFECTDSAVNTTFIQIFNQLRVKIAQIHDTSELKQALRQNPDKEEKIRLWNEIKNLCFSNAVCYVIAEAFLAVLLRVQLNILAGYIYSDNKAGLNNNSESRFSTKFQQAFLGISNFFINQGFKEFSDIALLNVKSCVAFIQLQDEIGLDNVENIFNQIQDRILSDYPERNLILNPGRFLLSSTESLPSEMNEREKELYKEAISETLEIMESQEILNLLTRACRRGFSLLIDKLADPFIEGDSDQYSADQQPDEGSTPPESGLPNIKEFVSPCRVRLPLVKFLPELSSVTDEAEEEESRDEWLACLLDSPDLKMLGANVYESFSSSTVSSETTLGTSAMQMLHSFKSNFTNFLPS